jgi:O-antigen/teichoic acid export membrane protein
MNSLVLRLRSSSYVRNVAVLVSGTSVAQALTIIASPILSRLYDPAEYGLFGVFMAVAAPLITIACLKYDQAVIVAKDDDEAADLIVVSYFAVLGLVAVALIVLLITHEWIAARLGEPHAGKLLLFVPLFTLFSGLFYANAAWANRQQSYRSISGGMIAQATGTTSLQIVLGLLGTGGVGLAIGRICGAVLSITVLTWRTPFAHLNLRQRAANVRQLWRVAKAHDKFPKFNTPVDLLMAFSTNFPSIFLALFFSPAAAGAYWFTYRLLEMPSNVIGEAVRRVFYQRAAGLHRDGQSVLPLWTKTTLVMATMAAPPVAVIVIFAPELFAFVFGAEWSVAGQYAQWLVLWWATTFARIPSAALIPVFHLQGYALVFEVIALAMRIAAIVAAIYIGDALTAVALYAIVGMIRDAMQCLFVVWQVRKQTAAGRPPASTA